MKILFKITFKIFKIIFTNRQFQLSTNFLFRQERRKYHYSSKDWLRNVINTENIAL